MNAAFTAVLAVLALIVFAARPVTGEARTGRQMLAAARAAGWAERLLWLVQVAELPLWVAHAAARTALYLVAVAVAWTACRAASLLAMDGLPIRLSRPKVVCS